MRADRYKDEDKTNQSKRERKAKRRPRRLLRLMLVMIPLLAAAVAGACVWTYRSAEDSLYVSFTEENPKVEFGSEAPAMDYVSGFEGEISTGSGSLDTSSPGSKTMVYTVRKPVLGGLAVPSKDFTLSYEVTDSVAPVILWNGSGTTLERGTDFDINNVIGFGDNADPSPSVTVDGEIDMSSEGTYPLHVTVTDSSGNSTDCELSVKVAESVPYYPDNSARTAFTDFAEANSGGGRIFGIDVSEWQGDIDFGAVRKAGCGFVIIRIGYSSDGEITMDGKFEQNIERARKAGLDTGIYLYSYDNTEEEAAASAEQIIEKLGGSDLSLPVVFDWEDFGRFQTYEMSFNDLNRMYDAFAEKITAAGYECMLYGSKNFLEKVWEDTGTRPVWLAHYTDKTDYEGPYRIWQASSTGRIEGISGDVDMDILYTDADADS